MAVNSPVKAPQATCDLGVARVDRRAAWLRGEHAEARTTTARSVSLRAPPFASWKWPSLPSISCPPSLSLEYPGPNARYVESGCFIITSTHHSLTLPPGTSLSLCPRSLELTEEEDRASTRTRFPSWWSFQGLTAPHTRRMNGHRPRGSNHDTMLEIYAIRLARGVM